MSGILWNFFFFFFGSNSEYFLPRMETLASIWRSFFYWKGFYHTQPGIIFLIFYYYYYLVHFYFTFLSTEDSEWLLSFSSPAHWKPKVAYLILFSSVVALQPIGSAEYVCTARKYLGIVSYKWADGRILIFNKTSTIDNKKDLFQGFGNPDQSLLTKIITLIRF